MLKIGGIENQEGPNRNSSGLKILPEILLFAAQVLGNFLESFKNKKNID